MHPLQRLIYQKGYRSVDEFAVKCGLNRSTLFYYFNGRTKKLNGHTIYALANALNVPYEQIVELTAEGL